MLQVINKNQYICDSCKKVFSWGSGCWVFGKMEYKTVQEQLEKEKHFCSDECKSKFKVKDNGK